MARHGLATVLSSKPYMLVYDRLEEVEDDDEGSQAKDDDKDPSDFDTEEWNSGDSDATEDVADATRAFSQPKLRLGHALFLVK